MILYFAICLVLVFFNFIVTIFFRLDKKINYYFFTLALLMLVANLGYLSLAASSTLNEAILANKICYIGGCFYSPIGLFLILRVCNYKYPKWLKYIVYGYSLIVFSLVLSTGYSNLYYSDQWIEKYMDATILCKNYGPFYFTFLIIIIGYVIVNFSILTYAIFKKKSVAKRAIAILIGIQILNVAIFLGGKLSIFENIDLMPASYVINGWILIFLKTRLDLYDVKDTVEKTCNTNELNGYLMLDYNLRYLGSNNIAKDIISDISGYNIDTKINEIPCLNFVNEWIDKYVNNNENYFRYDINDKYYVCKINKIINNKKCRGYVIEFKDDTDRIKYLDLLNKYNEMLKFEVDEKSKHILSIQNQVVLGMANIIENRDNSTGGHVKRTSDVIRILLRTIKDNNIYNIDDKLYDYIVRSAPMHDLGKIAIDDSILKKPGRFTCDEYEIMKTHAAKSAELVVTLLSGVEGEEFIKVAKNIAMHHHEKWDGNGYPSGLKGTDIPLEARIMAVADVYDALVSQRCYKDAMPFDKAYYVMIESMGTHFDPKMKEVVAICRNELELYYKNLK